MELYGALNDCLENHRDADAVALFALAGMDSAFDSLRVTTRLRDKHVNSNHGPVSKNAARDARSFESTLRKKRPTSRGM